MNALPYPVFTTVPDFNTVPEYGVSTSIEKVNNGLGKGFTSFPQVRPDLTFSFGFTFFNTSECAELEEFLRRRCGRAHPFYLPSWRRDLLNAAGNTGSHYLTCANQDYADRNLTNPATRADHWGRQIFIWTHEHGLYVDRVVSASVNEGLTYLDLERPLPWDVSPSLAICGYLHLARFAEDELKWKYVRPGLATVPARFMGLRQFVDGSQQLPVSELQIFAQRGFTTMNQDSELCAPLSNRYGVALGPETVGTTQAGVYSKSWAVWEHQGVLRIKPATSITYPDAGGTVCSLSGGDVLGPRITIAFNKAAGLVLAMQFPGTVELRRDGGATVTWPGVSPLLVNNRLICPALSGPDSDVICYYLKDGEAEIFARFEREGYAVEHVAAVVPTIPMELKRSTYAANVHTLELLDRRFQRVRLVSPVFP